MALPSPFFVLATQNPLEHEGTYALPEAQVDRFLFKIVVDYLSIAQEEKMLAMLEQDDQHGIQEVMNVKQLLACTQEVQQITLSDELKSYIVRIVDATRQVPELLRYGASPRASI